MAPELVDGHDVSVPSDVYAFALVVYLLISGTTHMWPTVQRTATVGEVATIPPGVSDLDASARRALTRALDRDPQRRFASAGAVMEAVLGLVWRRRLRRTGQTAGIAAVAAVALFAVSSRISTQDAPELGISPMVLIDHVGRWTRALREAGCTVHCKNQRLDDDSPAAWHECMRSLAGASPDVIHLVGNPGPTVARAAFAAGIPLILHAHLDAARNYEPLHPWVDRFVAVSDSVAASLRSSPVSTHLKSSSCQTESTSNPSSECDAIASRCAAS
jgi:hypothetical protein